MEDAPVPFARIVWTDPVTGCRGYAVIDRLVDGVSRGGIRMRQGCAFEEVHGLARVMSNKYGVLNLPSGGAKGGIDFDAHDAAAGGVLKRYVAALRPIFDDWWSAGEDFGVTQDDLDQSFVEAGMNTASHATLKRLRDPAAAGRARAAGVAVQVGGIGLSHVIGGYGVAEATAAACESLGMPLENARAVVQGFGSMGGASARYLAAKGVRIVGIADANGVIVNAGGLDVESLLKGRNSFGEIDRAAMGAGDSELPGSEWLNVPADILVPAALGDVIDPLNCDSVNARLVVEAANMPTTADAQTKLHERGVIVIPDFVANSAAIAWWWAIMREQIAATSESAFSHVSQLLKSTVRDVLALSNERRITPNEAAVVLARSNLDRLDLERSASPA
jgi:glutamate dehydrogenase (NAD(P)+)